MPSIGRLTPSTFKDMMSASRTKDKPYGDTAKAVCDQLVMDWLGIPREEISSFATEWGKEKEPKARHAYEVATFRNITVPMMKVADDMPFVAGTMDGLIDGMNGGIEIKSPFNSRNHLANLTEGKQLHELYMYQVQGYMWIYKLAFIDFVSYDPRFPAEHQLYVETVERNEEIIAKLKERCQLIYDNAQEQYTKITGNKYVQS